MKKHFTSYHITSLILFLQAVTTIVWLFCVALVYGGAPFETDHLYLLLFMILTCVSVKLARSNHVYSLKFTLGIAGVLFTLLLAK